MDNTKVKQSQYLASWLDLWAVDSEKDLRDAVILHGIDKSHPFERFGDSTHMRIDYGKNGLIAAYDCYLTEREYKENIPDKLIGMPYHEPGQHIFKELTESATPAGFSLGGPMPNIVVVYEPKHSG